MHRTLLALALLASVATGAKAQESKYYELPKGDYPHDVAAGPNGEVWYAGQKLDIAGRMNAATGEIERIALGKNSAPHGVIVGPDGAPWFTDGGQNAIVRVDPVTKDVKVWPLPPERMPYTNLNTAAFDGRGRIWFTGQNGIYGRLDPKSGDMKVWDAPKGRGAYGITATPKGDIWSCRWPIATWPMSTSRPARLPSTSLHQGPGRAPRVVRFAGPPVDQRVELRQRQRLRSGSEELEAVEVAGRQAAHVRRVGRSRRQGLADGMGRQCRGALRSRDGEPSRASRATGRGPTCARCWAGRARPGLPSPAPIASGSSAIRREPTEGAAAVGETTFLRPRVLFLPALAALLLPLGASHAAEGDAARGERAFRAAIPVIPSTPARRPSCRARASTASSAVPPQPSPASTTRTRCGRRPRRAWCGTPQRSSATSPTPRLWCPARA